MTLLVVVLAATIVLIPFAVLGFVSFVQVQNGVGPSELPLPRFVRRMAPNCGEVFFCMNNTDPNPSFIAYVSSGPEPVSWMPKFQNDASVFDVSDPYATKILVSGTYQFTLFAPLLSLSTPYDAAIVLIKEPGAILATPVLSGDLSAVNYTSLSPYPTHAAQATALAYMNAGESVRVGYVVSIFEALMTPGAYIGGFLVARDP